jgi:hypothetical protein
MLPELFPRTSGSRSDDVLRRTFSAIMYQSLGVELGCKDARSYTVGVEAFSTTGDHAARQHAAQKWQRLAAEQRMHTADVEDRYYGLSHDMMKSVSPFKLQAHTYTSRVHQSLLGFCRHPDAEERGAQVDQPASAVVPKSAVLAADYDEEAVVRRILDGIPAAIDRPLARAVAMIRSRIPGLVDNSDANTCFPVPPHALSILRDLLQDPRASFKIPEQGRAITLALAGHDLMAVLPTNAGKSLIALSVAYHYRRLNKTVVVVLPLRALHMEWKRKCRQHRLSYATWSKHNKAPFAAVVLVSVEHGCDRDFYQWARAQAAINNLVSICFDECHLIVEQNDFRAVMTQLAPLGRLQVQLLLISATVPVRIIPSIVSALGDRDIITIRAPTVRPELKYSYTHFNNTQEALREVKTIHEAALKRYGAADRMIVFAHTIKQCEKVQSVLDCPIYHGDLPPEDQDRIFRQWEASGTVIAATLALGYGINVPHVRDVVFYGVPKNPLVSEQEAGRAGRDGKVAYVYFLDVDMFRHPDKRGNLLGDKDVLPALRSGICIRRFLSEFFDGRKITCTELSHVQLCSVCDADVWSLFPAHFPREVPSWGPDIVMPYTFAHEPLPAPVVLANPEARLPSRRHDR